MDATLKALADLSVKAIPTVIFFIFLTHFLKRVFFQPIAKILEERHKQTAGMKELAEQAHALADKKTSEFETAVQLVRTQILQENEAKRRQWAEEQAQRVAEARAASEHQVEIARSNINKELESAKADVASTVDQLSAQIETSLLKRRAA